MGDKFIERCCGGLYETYMEDSRGGRIIKATNKFETDKDKEAGLPKRKARVEVLYEIKTGKVTIIKDGQIIFNERSELK